MADKHLRSLYPFAEIFEVDTNGTTIVDIWDIPAGTIITMVIAEIQIAGTGSAHNIIIGDDDDDNGFILAADGCGVTAGTLYGDTVAERGAYLNNDDAAGGRQHAGSWKVYASAGKELKLDCSAAPTTEVTLRVYVFGYRFSDRA